MTEIAAFIANLQSPDPDERRNAAWNLGRFRDITLVDPLLRVIADPDEAVRLRVVDALGNLRDPRVIEPLLARLTQDESVDVRARAASALGNQGSSEAADALLDALNDGAPEVRGAVAEALGLLLDARAAPQLITLMLNDPDDTTRYYAARSLVRLGSEEVVDALLQALTHAANADQRIRIIEVLGQLHDPRPAETLRALLDDTDEGVRVTVQWALQNLSKP